MTKTSLPLEASFLRKLKDRRLVRIERQLLTSDTDILDLSTASEEADGPVQITLNDGLVFYVVSGTERMSVEVGLGEMPLFGGDFVYRDLSPNSFWNKRLDVPIVSLEILQSLFANSDFPCQFGLKLSLANGYGFTIEYLSDEEHVDQIRITDEYSGPACSFIVVFGKVSST